MRNEKRRISDTKGSRSWHLLSSSLPSMQWNSRTIASMRSARALLAVTFLFAMLQCMQFMLGGTSSQMVLRSVDTRPPAVTSASTGSLQLPVRNIRLLGQFNYNTDASIVVEWVQTWSKYFEKISVVGPFNSTNMRNLLQAKVDAHGGHNDRGRWSPVASLSEALEREAATDKAERADAVLYAHDDALINLTYLAQGRQSIPTDRIAGSLRRSVNDEYSLVIPSDGSPIVYRYNNTETTDQTVFLRKLPLWFHSKNCIRQRLQMLSRSRTSADASVGWNRYGTFIAFNSSSNSSALIPARLFFFPAFTQSDMLLVPTRYTQAFVELATPHVQHETFLECAFPTIILWLLHQEEQRSTSRAVVADREQEETTSFGLYDSTLISKEATYLPLCTTFQNPMRGRVEMIEWCQQRGKDYYNTAGVSSFAVVHPFKIQQHGIEAYQTWLDRMQTPHFPGEAVFF